MITEFSIEKSAGRINTARRSLAGQVPELYRFGRTWTDRPRYVEEVTDIGDVLEVYRRRRGSIDGLGKNWSGRLPLPARRNRSLASKLSPSFFSVACSRTCLYIVAICCRSLANLFHLPMSTCPHEQRKYDSSWYSTHNACIKTTQGLNKVKFDLFQ